MENTEHNSNKPLSGMRILVVDDSKHVRESFESILLSKGALVVVAMDGAQALAETKISQFDAILMDLNMPGLNGQDTTARIRKMPFITKVVAMTGAVPANLDMGNKYLFDGFIQKPIKPVDLSRRVFDLVRPAQSTIGVL